MARLPKPGGDEGEWAGILNDFLLVSHNADGTIKNSGIRAIAAGTVGLDDLKTTNPDTENTKDFYLANDGTNLVWRKNTIISAHDFGAKGDGVTDDTAAIQRAVDSLTTGGGIIFQHGEYMVRGLTVRNNGVQLIGTSRWGVKITRLSGQSPLVDFSGSGTLAGHRKYCALTSITLNGNNLPGTLLRSYYSDTCVYRDVSFIHCNGMATDFIEAWDSRFENCSWEDCGSTTQPASLFRNSMPSGQFGYSQDNTNQIHFHGCRWEGFKNGALRLDGAANGSTSILNGVFLVSCKMESSVIAGAPFQIGDKSTIVFVNQLYIAAMAPLAGFTTPIDVIEDHGTQIFMTDVYVQVGIKTGLINSILHIMDGDPHLYIKLSAFLPTEEPASGTVIIDPAASSVTITSLWTNRSRKIVGNYTIFLKGGQTDGYTFPIDDTGLFRITAFKSGKDIAKISNDPTRQTFELSNTTDLMGFSDNYVTKKWQIYGATGAAWLAAGKFQVEATKGYAGINTSPYTGIAMLIRAAVEGDRGLAIVRPSSTATNRLMEFQDENYSIQGMAIDSNGRPLAVGTPPKVTAGDQVSYATPRVQVRDMAGSITAAVKTSATAGTIATLTFSRPFVAAPLSIMITDHSAVSGDLYISARSASSFTVSTRSALQKDAILNFDYVVVG